jgi:hypothetical protein
MPSGISQQQQQQQSITASNDTDSSSDIPVMLPVLPLSKRVHFLLHGDEVVKTGTVAPASEHVAVSSNDGTTAAPLLTKPVVRGMCVCMYVCMCVLSNDMTRTLLLDAYIHICYT